VLGGNTIGVPCFVPAGTGGRHAARKAAAKAAAAAWGGGSDSDAGQVEEGAAGQKRKRDSRPGALGAGASKRAPLSGGGGGGGFMRASDVLAAQQAKAPTTTAAAKGVKGRSAAGSSHGVLAHNQPTLMQAYSRGSSGAAGSCFADADPASMAAAELRAAAAEQRQQQQAQRGPGGPARALPASLQQRPPAPFPEGLTPPWQSKGQPAAFMAPLCPTAPSASCGAPPAMLGFTTARALAPGAGAAVGGASGRAALMAGKGAQGAQEARVCALHSCTCLTCRSPEHAAMSVQVQHMLDLNHALGGTSGKQL
jgi:hypothetical protein